MTAICGVDGCKNGWVVILKDLNSGAVTWSRVDRFEDIAKLSPDLGLVAVDIPIGLPLRGARQCDVDARRLLGGPRGSSVFPAPIRSVLVATSYEKACAVRLQAEGKKMSKQAWAIVPKIAEVDATLRGSHLLQGLVREVHPEVSFYFLAGGMPMVNRKKKVSGRDERLALLRNIYPQIDAALTLSERKRLGASFDDVIDGFVALWSAERIRGNRSVSFPVDPEKDSTGLRMEIVG